MRRIVREDPPNQAQTYLARKQADINSGKGVETTWKNARKTKTMRRIFEILIRMAGNRQRCMYCEDSRGTTIEHFWPKSVYRTRVFVWSNLLLLCQGCQNHKGNRFEVDVEGNPLLIDPTSEDPWEYLYFDSITGNITSKFDPTTGVEIPKGKYTVDSTTLPLNIEALSEGRLRTFRNLVRAIKRFVVDVDSIELSNAQIELVKTISDNDAYGLVAWFFLKEGADDEPFSILRENFNTTFELIKDAIKTTQSN
jgi:uncharacterized protein (TIGR02646 family)